MEKKRKINLILKSLMINNKIILILCVLFYNCNKKQELITKGVDKPIKDSMAQVVENIELREKKSKRNINSKLKSIGYFDYDNTKDTIYYFLDTSQGEPLYNCEIYFGNNTTKIISISTGSGYIKVSNCKKGCIEKSEITTGIYGSEEIEKYLYDEELENWFITEVISKSNNKIEKNNQFEEKWSIDDEMTK